MASGDRKPRQSKRDPARAEAAIELRQRGGKNLVFGVVAAAFGGILAQWSRGDMGDTGLSVTQIIYWCLVAGGALEAAIGVFQLYQSREIAAGRMQVPEWAIKSDPDDELGDGPVDVQLAPSRGKHIGWALFAGVLGLLLVFVFGGVGVYVGLVFLAWSLYHIARLVSIVAGKPQTIRVLGDRVVLPEGAVRGALREVEPTEIRHSYFLRRSAPRFHTLPVLVVELEDGALLYPRDWFASDRDQERALAALKRGAGG